MIYAVVFSVLVNGETLFLFHPTHTLIECRAKVVELTRELKPEEIYCGAFIPDTGPSKTSDRRSNV